MGKLGTRLRRLEKSVRCSKSIPKDFNLVFTDTVSPKKTPKNENTKKGNGSSSGINRIVEKRDTQFTS